MREHHNFEEWQILNECFVPSEKRRLTETDGHLVHTELPEPATDSELQLRGERCELMRKYMHQDYVIKTMAWDTKSHSVMSFLGAAEYEFIAIERRDPYAALLSALVAAEHDHWNQGWRDKTTKEYHEFDADMNMADFMGKCILQYYRVKKWMPIKKTLFFEDIIAMKPFEIIQSIGFEAEDDGMPLETKKMLGSGNSTLIRNIDEVRKYYETDVAPLLNTP